MPIRVTLQGLSEVRGTLPDIVPEAQRKVIFGLSQVAFDEVEAGAGRHTRAGGTGALRQSVFNRVTPGGDGRTVGHDLQRAPHALWVNAGTRPHVIRPKNKKALRWAFGGRFFFAKKVNHPGYGGDAYVVFAATAAMSQFDAILDRAMKGTP